MPLRGRLLCRLGGVLLLASAAVAQPVPVHDLGLVPGDLAVGAATDSQGAFGVARGDLPGGQAVYLIAWQDQRAAASGSSAAQSGMDIFAIRLDGNGNPIDPAPFPVDLRPGTQRNPKVTWNGENFLVSYESQDPVGGYFDTNIRGVRVAPSGARLDATPIMLAPLQQFWWVGGQAGQWLVTWAPYHADGYGTYRAGRRLGGNGQFLDAAPVMLMDWTYMSASSAVLAAGGEYLIVGPDWSSNELKARRVGLNGVPTGGVITLPAGTSGVGGNGAEYFVTWTANFVDFVGSRMTAAGQLLNPSGVRLTTGFGVGEPFFSHDGVNWWVGWAAGVERPRVSRVNASGAVLDPGGLEVPFGAGQGQWSYGTSAVASPGGGIGVFSHDGRANGDPNVYRLPMSAAGVPGAETCVSTSTPSQREPDLAEGPGGRIAVAYVSELSNADRVLVQFLGPDGRPTGDEPLEAASGPAMGRARIAWNGAVYLVVWSDSSVKARRLSPDGVWLDAAPISVMPGFAPDVEALGTTFLVAGAVYGPYPQFIYAQAKRVDGPTRAVLDGAPMSLGGGYVSAGVRVRADEARWLVTYQSNWSHDSSQSDAVYNFVNPDGTFTPPLNPATTSGGSGTPDAAFSGRTYLFVWRSNTLSNANNFISGRIMNEDGSFATGNFVIAEAPGRQLRPAVVWDGASFLVTWEDQRHQTTFFDERTDIYAARVNESGQVLSPGAFPVFAGPDADAVPAALAANGAVYIAASRLVTSPPLDSYRVGVALLGDLPCDADINCDGVPDQGDVACMVLAVAGDMGCFCQSDADFNRDGVPDQGDVADVIMVVAGAPCP